MKSATIIEGDIRNFIPWKKVSVSPEELIERIHVDQYLEKTEDVYRLNLISKAHAIDDLTYVLKLEDPNLRGIAWACLGGIHTFNGNYTKAFAAFHISLDQPTMDDVRSYVFTELSNLLRKLGYLREAISLLEAALTMAKNRKLKWRIKTYIGLSIGHTDREHSLKLLAESAHQYRKSGEPFRLCTVLRHEGLMFVEMGDFSRAEKLLEEAMSIAVEHDLTGHQYEVMNDRGWMWIRQKKYDEARALFDRHVQNELSPYLLSLALQNIGYLEYERANFREAIKFHSQSLQLTTRYEMRDMAFEDYYKLGLCHEKVEEFGLATHFYSAGYQELMKEIDIQLPILGYRKDLLNAYVEFLRNHQKIPHVDVRDQIFGFAVNKKLKEIRNIFHKGFFSLHLERSKNAPQLCKHLAINTRTYFLYQKKLRLKRGEPQKRLFEDNVYFNEYIESLTSLTWKEANRKFENDLFIFLMSKYQYSKKKLSEVLGVSYGLVTMKTRSLRAR